MNKLPANIDYPKTFHVLSVYDSIVNRTMFMPLHKVTMFAVNQTRGRCYWDSKRKEYTITIPVWLFNYSTEPGRLEYYICHELSHAYAGIENQHNHIFMEWFKRICPENIQHYEYEYKPKNAAAAGVAFVTADML